MKLLASTRSAFLRPVVSVAVAIVSVAALAGSALAHDGDDSDGKSRILTLKLRDYKNQMRELVEGGYDIAGANPDTGLVDIVQRADSRQPFDKAIFGQTVDVRSFDPAIAPDPGYKNPAEVEELVNRIKNNHPDLVQVESFGRTHEGRDLWAIRITAPATTKDGDKPVVFLNALHHAREVMTVEVALDAAEYLTTQYATNPEVQNWLNRAEIWIVPMVNPDGSNKVWTGDNMWRKNTTGSDGVDVNRNYPYRWNGCNGSSGSPYNDTYRGPSAGSENETQAMMGLIERIRPVYSISFHSYSELVLYPYSCDGERVPQREVVEGGGREMANLLVSDAGSGKYRPGTSWEILYAVDGGDIDWMYHEHNVIPYVIELNGMSQGFQPSFSAWRNKTVTKLRAAWQYVIKRALGSGVRGKVSSSGESAVDAVVRITNLAKHGDAGQMIKVKSDGTFHAVLVPGTYKLVVASGNRTVERTVLVGGDLLRMDVTL
ncbi:hypothetical protein EBZ80_03255 [bacterium]|nr:hypothetical protein [bacterium]